MQPVTDRFLPNLPTATWAPTCEVSYDGGRSWSWLESVDGTVTGSATQQARWSAQLQVSGVEESAVRSQLALRFRVWQTLVYGPDDAETIPQGVYRVKSIRRNILNPDLWDVDGVSAESALGADGVSARFLAPRTIGDAPAKPVLEPLIREVDPDARIEWRVVDPYQHVPTIIEQRNRWGVISGRTDDPSIAKALGARVFCDPRGVYVVSPPGAFTDSPVWTVTAGEGVRVGLEQELSVESVRNVVSVRGVRDDGKPSVGPVVLGDNDPNSPTWVGYDERPTFYASPLLETVNQCNQLAQSMLAERLGLAQQLTLTAAYNPALEPGDVVDVEMFDGSLVHHVLDEVPLPLRGGTSRLGTRASSLRLTGTPVPLLPAEDEEELVGADGGDGGEVA